MRHLSVILVSLAGAAAFTAWSCSSSPKQAASGPDAAQPDAPQIVTPPGDSCSGVPASARVAAWTADPHFCLYRFANVPGARQLALAPNGDLFVAVNPGKIVVLADVDGDGVVGAGEQSTFATLAGANHSVVVTADHVYASSATTVVRWAYAAGDRQATGTPETVVHDIESGGHETRTLLIDAKNRLYVSIGSATNVDTPAGPEAPPATRAQIRRYDLAALPAGGYSGNDGEVFAYGLRNEVGLTLDDQGRLWGVENGRDDLATKDGEDIHLDNPAEEVNLFDTARAGRNYGYPFCWSEGVLAGALAKGTGAQHLDPSVTAGAFTEARCQDASVVVPPAFALRAHLAPLGIVQYRGRAYPPELSGDLFVTSHGSWNHLTGGQVGRVIVRLRAGGKGPIQGETFLGEDDGTGKLREGSWAVRPVSIVVDAGGLLTFSDDAAGTIHKIGYRPEAATDGGP